MDIPDNRKRLFHYVEDLGRSSEDTRMTVHRAITRMKKLDPGKNGTASLRKNLPVLLNFMTSEPPENCNLFDLRRMQMLSKGALLYLIREKDFIPDAAHGGGLEDDAWVVSRIVEELKRLFPSIAASDGDSLSPEGKKEAEKQLMELAGLPCRNPGELIDQSQQHLARLEKMAEHDFIRTLITNATEFISYIAAFTLNEDYNSNEYCFRIATGALRYLLKADDIVNDNLGAFGYIDDAFVLELAHELFEKNRPPGI